MRIIFVSFFSILMLFQAHAQSKMEQEITSLLKDTLVKGKEYTLRFEVKTSNCILSGKKEVQVSFLSHGTQEKKFKVFRTFSLAMLMYLAQNVLKNYSECDCVTISIQREGSNQIDSDTYYLIAGRLVYNNNGKIAGGKIEGYSF